MATRTKKARGGTDKAAAPRAKSQQKPAKAKAPRASALNAAAVVLGAASKPMRVAEVTRVMRERGLWKSPRGKTPEATLHAAMIREIMAKGKQSRFRKVGGPPQLGRKYMYSGALQRA